MLFEQVALEETGQCDGEEHSPGFYFVRRRQAPPGLDGCISPCCADSETSTAKVSYFVYVRLCLLALAAILSFPLALGTRPVLLEGGRRAR